MTQSKEKIGLYFGSFNPIHIGHLIIADYIVQDTDLHKIRLKNCRHWQTIKRDINWCNRQYRIILIFMHPMKNFRFLYLLIR